jgi:hypothetical protein
LSTLASSSAWISCLNGRAADENEKEAPRVAGNPEVSNVIEMFRRRGGDDNTAVGEWIRLADGRKLWI